MNNLNKETTERIIEIINSIGKETYLEILFVFERDFKKIIEDTKNNPSHLDFNLHQLKGQCYAVGFQTLGKYIDKLQSTAMQGATMTVYSHLKDLKESISTHILSVRDDLSELHH